MPLMYYHPPLTFRLKEFIRLAFGPRNRQERMGLGKEGVAAPGARLGGPGDWTVLGSGEADNWMGSWCVVFTCLWGLAVEVSWSVPETRGRSEDE